MCRSFRIRVDTHKFSCKGGCREVSVSGWIYRGLNVRVDTQVLCIDRYSEVKVFLYG